AVRNVLYHSDEAEREVTQDAFLENFPLRDWIYLDNVFERYQIRRHTPEASMLYILAEQNLPNLILLLLKRTPNTDIQGERYCFPIFAALANCHENALRALLTPDLQLNSDISRDFRAQDDRDILAHLKDSQGRTPL